MFTFVWFSKSFGESIVRVRTTHFLKRGVMNSRRSDFQSKAQSGELYNYVAVCKENIWWIKYTANTNALASNTFKTCTWTCNHWKWGTISEASSSTQLGLHHCFYNFINLHLTVKINPFVLTTAQDFLSFIFDPWSWSDVFFSTWGPEAKGPDHTDLTQCVQLNKDQTAPLWLDTLILFYLQAPSQNYILMTRKNSENLMFPNYRLLLEEPSTFISIFLGILSNRIDRKYFARQIFVFLTNMIKMCLFFIFRCHSSCLTALSPSVLYSGHSRLTVWSP